MQYKWDDHSQSLLHDATDDAFVGIVEEVARTVILYRAARSSSPADRKATGHEDLLRLGAIDIDGKLGFSFHVKDGKLHSFYRNSFLNSGKRPWNCISFDEMEDIIELIGLERAEDFCSYP